MSSPYKIATSHFLLVLMHYNTLQLLMSQVVSRDWHDGNGAVRLSDLCLAGAESVTARLRERQDKLD